MSNLINRPLRGGRYARTPARRLGPAAAVLGTALFLVFLVLGCQLDTLTADDVKSITAFSFDSLGVVAAIDQDEKKITATVPHGMDLTALVATFTTTGVKVTVGSTVQESGVTVNDFSSPVSYKVWAANGSSRRYTAVVTVAPASGKAITSFSFAGLGVTATIDENAKSIAATVPLGTDVTTLVATFTTTGASVTVGATPQESGVSANDFTSPVVYSVTAADGSTASYTVTVTTSPDPSAKAITLFLFMSPSYSEATIDEAAKTIQVALPGGTDLTALVASFLTTGSSVRVGDVLQASGVTENDFSVPVIYTVAAADGSTADYTVTVTATSGIECSFYFCPPGYVCGYDGYCVPHCFDGERNGDEGGVDCGGSCAAKCLAGSHCWLNYDCASGICYYDVCQ